jgi:hypothetical protein
MEIVRGIASERAFRGAGFAFVAGLVVLWWNKSRHGEEDKG